MVHEALSKVELHCHLIGVITPALLRDLRADGHPILVEPEAAAPVQFGEGPDGFGDWLTRVEPYKSADWKTYLPILGWYIDRLVEQRVVYAEMMISPMMFSRDFGALAEEFAEFRSWVREREAGRIQIEFLFLVPRSLPDELIEKDTRRCVFLAQENGISGISIAGLESHMPASRFARMCRELKDNGLGIEIHAGELGGPEEVREALDVGFADRIGHGIRAFEDEDLVARLCDEQVHLEFCPTSNLKMGAARSFTQHPIGRARDLGMNFSINTDDPGAFGCSMNSEFGLVNKYFSFSKDDFSKVARNSLASRFAKELRCRVAADLADAQSEAVAIV